MSTICPHSLFFFLTSSSSDELMASSCLSSLPDDVTLKVASFLDVREICLLGSCSQHLRDLCESNCIWMNLFYWRWPAGLDPNPSHHDQEVVWKEVYMKQHRRIADGVSSVIDFVQRSYENGSIEVRDYKIAVADLGSLGIGFEDVKLLLFTTKNSVFVNLIGLHYSIFSLGIKAEEATEVLNFYRIGTRRILISSFTLRRLIFGFQLPEKCFSRGVSLSELTMAKHEETRSILNRGTVLQVLQVQSSSSSTWEVEYLDCIRSSD